MQIFTALENDFRQLARLHAQRVAQCTTSVPLAVVNAAFHALDRRLRTLTTDRRRTLTARMAENSRLHRVANGRISQDELRVADAELRALLNAAAAATPVVRRALAAAALPLIHRQLAYAWYVATDHWDSMNTEMSARANLADVENL